MPFPPRGTRYDLLPEVEQPNEVSIAISDGMFIKHYRIKKAGTYLPQHSHRHNHVTMVCHGSIRAWVDGKYLGVFTAPKALDIRANTKHIFEVMEDNTTLACIHRIDRTGEIEVTEEHQIV